MESSQSISSASKWPEAISVKMFPGWRFAGYQATRSSTLSKQTKPSSPWAGCSDQTMTATSIFFFSLIPGVALGFRFVRNGHQGSRTQRLWRKMEFFFRFCFLRFDVLTKASKTALILARAAATRLGVSWKLANTFRETQQYYPRTDFGLGPRQQAYVRARKQLSIWKLDSVCCETQQNGLYAICERLMTRRTSDMGLHMEPR